MTRYEIERKYINLLKKDILDNCTKLNQRLSKFPVKTVKRFSKLKFDASTKITVSDKDYTIIDALKIMKDKYSKILKQSKPSFYNSNIRALIHDIKGCYRGKELPENVYNEHKDEVDKSFTELNEDLLFCLYVIRELSKIKKEV